MRGILMPSRRKSQPLSPGLRAAQTRIRNTRLRYIEGVKNDSIPMPEKGTPEAKSLARLASLARWGKGPKVMRKHSGNSGTMRKKINYRHDRVSVRGYECANRVSA